MKENFRKEAEAGGKSKKPVSVHVRNVSFMYEDIPVLREVNISLRERDFVAVIGPNGAGKTTLAKLILGLLQPSGGSVEIFGESPSRGSRHIGYVPQYSVFDPEFPIRVLDVVLMGRLTGRFGFYSRKDRSAARAALEEVGLGEYHNRPFSALSGGQRQRVLIARALAGDPAILIMDEPTTNVDAAAEERMKTLLKALNDRMTILLITHDLGFVPDLVNKVLCVNVRAVLHDTRDVSAPMIQELFHSRVKMVDHRHTAAGGEA